MRVIEAQCSWSSRLTITSHIKHERMRGCRLSGSVCQIMLRFADANHGIIEYGHHGVGASGCRQRVAHDA
jgi:hypothetical protein